MGSEHDPNSVNKSLLWGSGGASAGLRGRVGSSPHNWEEDGTAADEIHQEQDLLPESIVTGTLLTGLDDNVCNISQDLWG